MITSNLTEGEREVLYCFKWEGILGRPSWIAKRLKKQLPWICYILKRLIESGHVRKIRRGVYVRTT